VTKSLVNEDSRSLSIVIESLENNSRKKTTRHFITATNDTVAFAPKITILGKWQKQQQ
jgi:hypothetical protein